MFLGNVLLFWRHLIFVDEYFKALESDDSVKVEIEKLNSKIDNLKRERLDKRELDDAKKRTGYD